MQIVKWVGWDSSNFPTQPNLADTIFHITRLDQEDELILAAP